jgi:hypothetical protein
MIQKSVIQIAFLLSMAIQRIYWTVFGRSLVNATGVPSEDVFTRHFLTYSQTS